MTVGEVRLNPLGGPLEETPEVELAYALNQEYWGRGYATEAARGALRYGFETLELPRIWVLVNPENHRSLRVAAKLDLVLDGRRPFKHHESVVFFYKDRPVDSHADGEPRDVS